MAAAAAAIRTTGTMRRNRPPGRGSVGGTGLAPAPTGAGPTVGVTFDQPDVTGPGSFRGLLGRELHALALAEQLKDGAPNGAAVEEVFDAALIANKAEAFIDEQA